jgi:hypothetical protein
MFKLIKPPKPLTLTRVASGNFGDIHGSDWNGFEIAADGKLYTPCFKRGFEPYQIQGMFFRMQQLNYYERAHREAKKALESLQRELDKERYRAEQWRAWAMVNRTLRYDVRL